MKKIPFFAQVGRHTRAKTESSEEPVLETVLFHEVDKFSAGGVPPDINTIARQGAFDQDFNSFDTHAKSVDREAVDNLRRIWNLADNELRLAGLDGRPRISAVMAGKGNGKDGYA